MVVLGQLTRLDALYQALGEDAAATVQICANALRERVYGHGGKVHHCASHQVLATFHNPRRALDWIEQCSTILMPLLSGLPMSARPGLVLGFDYADTTEIEGALHSVAISRIERLTWGRNDDVVFTQAAVPIIPAELKGRVSRVPAPKELGAVWRIGVKETSLMTPTETQAIKSPSRSQGQDIASANGPRPRLSLEMLDRRVELGATDAPLILGRGVAEGFEIPDPRVSRLHAIIEPRGTQFVLVDASSNGTWVQMDGQPDPVELKQQEYPLHGAGVISFGIAPTDFSAPTVRFSVTVPTGFVTSRHNTQPDSGFSNSGFSKSDFGPSSFNTTLSGSLPRK